MKKLLPILLLLISTLATAQDDQKVILITLDGLRWQELFGGADSVLINMEEIAGDVDMLKEAFWRDSKEERRETLFPFVWNTIAKEGMIVGNRWKDSKFEITNGMNFSYPGYNEILTGSADDERINSNDKNNNPNVTVLEAVNNTAKYNGKVLAFGSWDVFPYIINEERSGIPVNAGYRHALTDSPTDAEILLNKIQDETPKRWWGVRYDTFTHNYMMEAIKREHPKLVYISYGETDDFAHDDLYYHYLISANRTDQMIAQLWDYLQNDPFYKDQTTILITTDHGRGEGWGVENDWSGHGYLPYTWLMAIGNKVSAKGEIQGGKTLYTNQIARTVSELLEVDFDGAGKAGTPIKLN